MSKPVSCDNELTNYLEQIAKELASKGRDVGSLHKGIYAGLLGPTYETLAEVEMLRRLGADAVGMSTVPELQAASSTKAKAAAISVITNSWSQATIHGHKEVLSAAKAASQRLDKILRQAILAR
jgi:purine-nucleoside phosphorylase